MLFDNWKEDLQPLMDKYSNRKHPLAYQNTYQLLIMVLLSAQDSDANINVITTPFFEKYPSIKSLSIATNPDIEPYLYTVENYKNKMIWLVELANDLMTDENIPTNLTDLTAIKGIGRKSANVILREINKKPEGIIVDLHVIRVAPRIGLTLAHKDGNKIEKQLMDKLPYEMWNEIGMALSFLGREICRPTNPVCKVCPVNSVCIYYTNNIK